MATKKDLVQNLCRELTYLSEDDATIAVDSVLEYLTEELVKENRIEVRGFGSMSIRKRKYAGRDEEYNSIYYRMSKNVLEKLNG